MRDIDRLVHRVFNTADGKQVLNWLEAQYQGRKLYNDNPNKTIYNVGQFDLVQDLKNILEDANSE